MWNGVCLSSCHKFEDCLKALNIAEAILLKYDIVYFYALNGLKMTCGLDNTYYYVTNRRL